MITDDEDFNENCMWIDGEIYCLNAARFKFEKDIMRPWEIKNNRWCLDLLFTPSGRRAEKINAGFIVLIFTNPSVCTMADSKMIITGYIQFRISRLASITLPILDGSRLKEQGARDYSPEHAPGKASQA